MEEGERMIEKIQTVNREFLNRLFDSPGENTNRSANSYARMRLTGRKYTLRLTTSQATPGRKNSDPIVWLLGGFTEKQLQIFMGRNCMEGARHEGI